MRRLAPVALLAAAACAGTPEAPPPDVPLEAPAQRVKLVFRPVSAQPGLEATAGELESSICTELSADVRYEVVCPADLRAASDVLRMRMTTGMCEGDECEQQMAALMDGEEVVHAQLLQDASGLTLAVSRLGKDATPQKHAKRTVPAFAALAPELPGLVKDVLAR